MSLARGMPGKEGRVTDELKAVVWGPPREWTGGSSGTPVPGQLAA